MLAALCLPSVLALAGCSGLQGTGDLTYVEGAGNVVEVAVDERGDAVDLAGETLDGETLDVGELRGTVAVLNVWWSGCGPCRTEMPMLVDLDEEISDQVVAFAGIDTRDADVGNALAFEREFGVEYPSIYDQSGQTLLNLGEYAPTSQPSTVVLDDEGRVAALISGPIPSRQTLVDVLEDVVGGPVVDEPSDDPDPTRGGRGRG